MLRTVQQPKTAPTSHPNPNPGACTLRFLYQREKTTLLFCVYAAGAFQYCMSPEPKCGRHQGRLHRAQHPPPSGAGEGVPQTIHTVP